MESAGSERSERVMMSSPEPGLAGMVTTSSVVALVTALGPAARFARVELQRRGDRAPD